MEKNKFGILGGMGPFATSVFFERIIEQTKASKDQEHLDIMILNHATLPDRTELIMNHEKEPFIKKVQKDMQLFEYAEVANIAIPCNTSHYFYEDIQRSTNIPVIHMVRSTAEYVANIIGENKKIAVLATDGTIQSGVYQQELEKVHLEQYTLPEDIQKKIMNIIYGVKSDIDFETNELDFIIQDLIEEHDCAIAILACTELSTVQLNQKSKQVCIDALDVLVRESIIRSNKQLKHDVLNEKI